MGYQRQIALLGEFSQEVLPLSHLFHLAFGQPIQCLHAKKVIIGGLLSAPCFSEPYAEQR